MSFYPLTDGWKVKYFRKKASQAFTSMQLVAFETDGGAGDPIEPADASDALILGIGMRTVASGDSDYAENTRYPVLVPSTKGAEMFGDVTSGLVVADEGLLVDLTDAANVDRTASTTDVLIVTKFLTATTGQFAINLPSLG